MVDFFRRISDLLFAKNREAFLRFSLRFTKGGLFEFSAERIKTFLNKNSSCQFSHLAVWFLISASALFLVSCGNSDLPKYYSLDSLRILAILPANPTQAEVSAGDTVGLQILMSDTRGGGRALTYSAEACFDPGVGAGADPSCAGSLTKVTLATNQSLTLPAAPNYTGVVSPAGLSAITIPSTILANRSAADQYNGVAYLVTVQLRASDGTQVSAFRRIVVSNKSTKNSSPTLTQILSNGVSLTAVPTGAVSLTTNATGTETFLVQQSNGTLSSSTEALQITWFVSDGKLSYTRTIGSAANTFTPPSPVPTGRNVLVYAVVRDGRGGVAYAGVAL